MEPPLAVLPPPTLKVMSPPFPLLAEPVSSDNAPDAPDPPAPVLMSRRPLTAPLDVDTEIEPLPTFAPEPEVTVTEPPVPAPLVLPALISIPPPDAACPDPT